MTILQNFLNFSKFPQNSPKKNPDTSWIVFMTTFPPRECGIANFSKDLMRGFDEMFSPLEEAKVISMENEDSVKGEQTGVPVKDAQSQKVIFRISENNHAEYVAAAQNMNSLDQVKLISIQHEFGIFGQNDGEQILTFMNEIQKPTAVTFHTVLVNPSERISHIVKRIAERAGVLIVMTQASRILLETKYGIPSEKIKCIPHGIHPLDYTESKDIKKELAESGLTKFGNLEGKKIISTFGFLNFGKGIEFAIDALPAIVKEFPDVMYLVLGATHPVVFRREGPVYLNSLKAQAERLGVSDHITFYDSFLATKDLLKFLQATDIYLALSQNPEQAVSGTLTYALGAGRPVISTPFMQAKEIVTDEVGRLVEFNDSHAIQDAVISFLKDEKYLANRSRAAYFRTRGMVWPNITLSYMSEFIAISPELAEKEKALPSISLDHIKKMTDDFGMFQFAILDEPNPLSGYTLDDNTRSLIAISWQFDRQSKIGGRGQEEIDLAEVYLRFLEISAKDDGSFVNYFDVDRVENHFKNTQETLDDAHARALWAIAEVHAGSLPIELRMRADILFKKQLAQHKHYTSPRAAALCIKAFSIWITTISNDARKSDEEEEKEKEFTAELIAHITYYADFLMSILKDNETPDWTWFEDTMTYSNAVLPESLFLAHKATGYEHYLDAAKRTLDFLLSHSLQGNVCMPIGQAGWFKRGGVKETFDQQPEEVSALVLALRTATHITHDERYIPIMRCVFSWFLGNNMLGQVIYSYSTGGCYDGLGDQYINLNQGAESTVSYMLARLAVEEAGSLT